MLKLKSKSDVITNSSDEVYAIRTGLSPEEVTREWYSFLENDEHSEDYGTYNDPEWTGVFDAIIKEKEPGIIAIDYPVMCNVYGFRTCLEELFGKENVLDIQHTVSWDDDKGL